MASLVSSSSPEFKLQSMGLAQAAAAKADFLMLLVQENFELNQSADALSQFLNAAIGSGDFSAQSGQILISYKAAGIAAPRIVLVGVGKGAAKEVNKAVTAALAAYKPVSIKNPKVKQAVFAWAQTPSAAALQAAMQAAANTLYAYKTTKSVESDKAQAPKIGQITLAMPEASALKNCFTQSTASIAGVAFAKEWGNRPANHATPTMLGAAAQSLANRGSGIQCEVLGPKEVAKLKMGSFMAVAQGSQEPLRFIVLRYAGGSKQVAPTVLIGKGITFDTGGISLKPAPEMDEMKFDMCGAASVLGVFKSLSILKPKINVIGLIPTCENMPSSKALKPGDVVTSMSGQTIEVLNTDAEGRLILCDALTYAERFKPAAVVDIATLTGACVIALGAVRSGLFSSHDELAAQLLKAGETAQDLAWRMPLDDEYAEGLKSNFADVANVGGRPAGSITAAKFLQRFAKSFPWAHLDIAGTAWKSGAAKGATGRPVPLLLQFLLESKPFSEEKMPKMPADRAQAAPKKRVNK